MSEHVLESEIPSKNGMKLFDIWLNEAKTAFPSGCSYFVLSTITPEMKPTSRALFLSHYTDKHFHFFTNGNSPKVKDIKNNPFVSMYFLWPPLNKAVRIEGTVTQQLKGDEDFARCPSVGMQITLAAIEKQSQPVKTLEEVEKMKAKCAEVLKTEGSLKCPSFWVGFEVLPESIEFIKVQPDYASDRLKFYNPDCCTKDKFDDQSMVQTGDDGWFFVRLTP